MDCLEDHTLATPPYLVLELREGAPLKALLEPEALLPGDSVLILKYRAGGADCRGRAKIR